MRRNLSRSLALSGLAVNVGVLPGVREGLMRGIAGLADLVRRRIPSSTPKVDPTRH